MRFESDQLHTMAHHDQFGSLLDWLVFDRVSWSDTPAFHNTLVVGSSPTSSTTQSPTTGESGLVRNAPLFIGARDGGETAYSVRSKFTIRVLPLISPRWHSRAE